MGTAATPPERIPVYRSLIQREELAAAARCLEQGWLGMGRDVGNFEQAVHRAIGSPEDRHVAAVSTGHAALHLSLLVAGIGPGDEVVLPAFTHLSDVQAILACGATPVFCDIDPMTLCLDVDSAADLMTPAVRAIIAMDYGGHLCDHDAVGGLARDYDLRVVHDAAHSFGSTYRGKPVGSTSDICMFSFDPVKAVTAVDAGVVVVRTEEELRRVQRLRLLGSDQPASTMYGNARTWDYDTVEDGFRYHLSNLHGAIGCSQVAKLDLIRSTRQATCQRYTEQLKEVAGVIVPATDFDGVNPFLYAIRVDRAHRDPLRAHLESLAIDTGVHWRPAHLHSHFSRFRHNSLAVTDQVGAEIISLPLHSCMPDDLVDRVCEGVSSYF
jgi:dTDP-4-amino-4,6-dideoxygalactose transaminase